MTKPVFRWSMLRTCVGQLRCNVFRPSLLKFENITGILLNFVEYIFVIRLDFLFQKYDRCRIHIAACTRADIVYCEKTVQTFPSTE